MKHVILMRHAKAERQAASGEDFDRSLTERGLEDVRIIAALIARDPALRPTAALVSPAARTEETFATLAEALALQTIPVQREPGFYNAPAQVWRSAIEAWVDEAPTEPGTLVVVGHNPGIQALALELFELAAAGGEPMAKIRDRFPTAATVILRFDAAGRPAYDAILFPSEHGGGAGE